MEKDRELRDESENTASRRKFLYQAGGAGLIAAAAALPHSCAAQPASGESVTARGVTVAGRKCHIVSVWVHPDYDNKPHLRLALTHDPSGMILLDEAADSKDGTNDPMGNPKQNQIWGILRNADTTMSITNSTGKFLTRNPDPSKINSLSLDVGGGANKDMPTVDQLWWIGHPRDHDLIMTPPYGDGKQYALTTAKAPKLSGSKLDQNAVVLVLLDHMNDVNYYGKGWKITTADGIALNTGPRIVVNQTHVPDQCDSTWHNPACPGNPATWTGCVQASSTTCKCSHA